MLSFFFPVPNILHNSDICFTLLVNLQKHKQDFKAHKKK